jgi:TonB family protein
MREIMWYSMLAGAALKGTAVLAAAWLAAFLLRRHSAAARHLVWTAALAAVLALPFLSMSLPAWRVAAPAALPAVVFQTSASAADAGPSPPSAPGAQAAPDRPAPWRPDWRMWLALLWAAGTAASCLRMLAGWLAMLRIRRRAARFPGRDLCAALAGVLGIRRPVQVLETGPGSMPMSFGILRPTVLVPSGLADWGEERRRIVLLHELAHVRRGDTLTHLMARAALALYWWNPLAWIAWREFLKERERAADDLVLAAGARASDYAGHLLEVARTMQSAPALGYAAVAMARRSQLEGRLLAILDSGVNRTAPGRAWTLVAALAAAAMVAPLAAVRAQEVPAQAVPADVDAAIRAARSQKNYETLENAAKAAEQSRNYDVARKLLESAAAIRAEVAGGQSVEYGVGLLMLADLEWKNGRGDAVDLYARAAQVLGERPEAGRAMTCLGLAALKKKDFPRAFDYFQQAQRVDPPKAGAALMWMAVVRQREQNLEEAERLFQSALSVEDPKSVDAAVTMEVYAGFLRELGRESEAGEFEARAAAIQKTGAPHPEAAGVYRSKTPGVTPPSVLRKVEPEYSEEARAARLQGAVILMVVIGTDGLTRDVRVVKGLGLGLDEKALEAIGQWQFQPGAKDGRSVAVTATIEVNYRLM